VALVAHGLPNDEIAEALVLSLVAPRSAGQIPGR
jgi:hypothetical protein